MNTAYLICLLTIGGDSPPLRIDAALLTVAEQAEVPAREAGLVGEVAVREGQVVRAGELLLRLDDTDARLPSQKPRWNWSGRASWPPATSRSAWLSAGLLAVTQADWLAARLPRATEFLTAGNLVWLAVTLAGPKVCHEFGHALTCRHFGGRCHELGLLLLVFTPCLYCNVSDAWLLPSKWRRMAISAAGMTVEVALAAAATWAWWLSEPGLFSTLCLNVMVVGTINTLVFNGNPLLRFDGYFLLSDWLETPNLRPASDAWWRAFWSRAASIEGVAFVEQSAIGLIDVGQPVTMRLDALPAGRITGRVLRIGDSPLVAPPSTLIAKGQLPVTDAGNGRHLLETYYQVTVAFDASPPVPLAASGHAQIHVRPRTLVARAYATVCRLVRW